MHRLITAAAAAVVLSLAACGSQASGAGTADSAGSPAAAPPSCHTQYEAWKHGAASSEIATFKSAIRAIASAGDAQDMLKLRAALRRAGAAATRLAATPPPRCSDPKGYFSQMLAKVTAAGDNTKAGSGLGALILAEVPLKTVPAIEKKLTAELNQTVGVKR
jgi:hypothetical protein